jgi:hypothetical protein
MSVVDLGLQFRLPSSMYLTEIHTNLGRIDAAMELDWGIVIIEYKYDSSAEEAIRQIHRKRYAERFSKSGKKILLMGINFGNSPNSKPKAKSEEPRIVVDITVEPFDGSYLLNK